MKSIEIANMAESLLIPKGRNRPIVEAWLASMGLKLPEFPGSTFQVVRDGKKFTVVRDKDVMPYLDMEVADIGFVGSDVVNEFNVSPARIAMKVEQIGEATGAFALLAKCIDGAGVKCELDKGNLVTVATSYPVALSRYATDVGLNLRSVYQPLGSAEVAIDLGVSRTVFDIVSTGKTVNDNELVVMGLGDMVVPCAVYKDRSKRVQRTLGYNGIQV